MIVIIFIHIKTRDSMSHLHSLMLRYNSAEKYKVYFVYPCPIHIVCKKAPDVL